MDTHEIPMDLEQNIEHIASLVHASWMRQKQTEGWKYGKVLDRATRAHPSLTDYDNLPESEKELDRVTARQVIQALLTLGYRIER